MNTWELLWAKKITVNDFVLAMLYAEPAYFDGLLCDEYFDFCTN